MHPSRILALSALAVLAGCSQARPSTPDGRQSPFAPGEDVELRKSQKMSPAAVALSPSFGGGKTSDDPYWRAVECAAAIDKLKMLVRQFAGQVDSQSIAALDQAGDFYRTRAERLAPEGSPPLQRAIAQVGEDPSMAGPAAAQKAAACIRQDAPSGT